GYFYFNSIQFVIGVDHMLKPTSGVTAREIHEASKRFLESTRLVYPFLRLVKISFCRANWSTKKTACTAQGYRRARSGLSLILGVRTKIDFLRTDLTREVIHIGLSGIVRVA